MVTLPWFLITVAFSVVVLMAMAEDDYKPMS